MQVILLEKVEKLGTLGDMVTVKPGYARNFLLPTGRAKMATPENIAEFEARRAELERLAAERLKEAQNRADAFAGQSFTVVANAGTEGKLFGSVGADAVAAAAEAAGMQLDKREVRMPEGGIRQVGEFEISLHLHSDVNVDVTVVVEAEA